MNKFKIIIAITIFILSFKNSYSKELKIVKIVGNEIITNIDINNQSRLLVSLNQNLNNVDSNEIYNYVLNSLINDKIKLIELKKYFNLDLQDNDFLKNNLEKFYKKYGFKSEVEFVSFLNKNNLNFEDIKFKVKLDSLWNSLIFEKFRNEVKVNEIEIEKKLKLLSSNSNMNEYNISELFFTAKDKTDFKIKRKKILNSINLDGFENASILYNENFVNKSGKIGWISENKLGTKINEELKITNIGNITKTIRVANGFVILLLNDKRNITKKINLDEERKNLISDEKDKQLNQLSTIYFNKISKNAKIKEL